MVINYKIRNHFIFILRLITIKYDNIYKCFIFRPNQIINVGYHAVVFPDTGDKQLMISKSIKITNIVNLSLWKALNRIGQILHTD